LHNRGKVDLAVGGRRGVEIKNVAKVGIIDLEPFSSDDHYLFLFLQRKPLSCVGLTDSEFQLEVYTNAATVKEIEFSSRSEGRGIRDPIIANETICK
jgi:hypothetical protein